MASKSPSPQVSAPAGAAQHVEIQCRNNRTNAIAAAATSARLCREHERHEVEHEVERVRNDAEQARSHVCAETVTRLAARQRCAKRLSSTRGLKVTMW
jgi:hypothetical protein